MPKSRKRSVGSRKEPVGRIKDRCWRKFSEYIRLRDGPITVKCVTCGRSVPAFGLGCAQAGHYVAGRSFAVLFDARGCHAQCWTCNYVKHGATIDYRIALVMKYGERVVEELESNRRFICHPIRSDYEELERSIDILLKDAHNGRFDHTLIFKDGRYQFDRWP